MEAVYPPPGDGPREAVHTGAVDPLLGSWTDALGHGPDVAAAGRDLLARWDEPHRRYHDRRHLAEVLDALRQLTAGTAPPGAVVCAAWLHDAVHDGRDDDEERSAVLATEVLSDLDVAAPVVAEVARLVRLTLTHDPAPEDAAGALLSDADLAVLGASPQRYARYAADVRREYAHLDDVAFRAGRTAVLQSLLDRPRLYRTSEGARRWEAAARRNLRDEISALAGASVAADRRP
jgi:predicted metal-dependent HD superfamily phosphohydrolase